MHVYDVAVIGAGPAGTMAAIRAARLKKDTVLIERNTLIGRKLLLTGAGRCNLTNTAPIETFVEKFGAAGLFLRQAFYKFSNKDLMDFFENGGLRLKSERQGRVFPESDKSSSVVDALQKSLKERGVTVMYKTELLGITKKDGVFELSISPDKQICAKKVILSTGGVSFPETGSRGEGLRMAKNLGHDVLPLRAALVPLRTKEAWVKELQGLSLDNIRITFLSAGKKIISGIGELMFTHFGVSGPLVLDLSERVVALTSAHKEVKLFIDLKPGLDEAKLEARLLADFAKKGAKQLSGVMEGLLPKRMALLFIRLARLDPARQANQITQTERGLLVKILKAFPLMIEGALSIETGMVTAGGVSTKQINPRTMESKVLAGLYFAGEIIDGAAPSGGYNLQQAFSTGFLAGEAAANA